MSYINLLLWFLPAFLLAAIFYRTLHGSWVKVDPKSKLLYTAIAFTTFAAIAMFILNVNYNVSNTRTVSTKSLKPTPIWPDSLDNSRYIDTLNDKDYILFIKNHDSPTVKFLGVIQNINISGYTIYNGSSKLQLINGSAEFIFSKDFKTVHIVIARHNDMPLIFWGFRQL